MVRRNKITLAASAFLALMLTAGPAAMSGAAAQEAIMLETVGAVRMASPQEIQRMNEEASRQQLEHARPATLPRQQAAAAD